MIEKGKSGLLFLLVVLSLVQSYFLAYSKPYLEARVNTELSYVKTEPLGKGEKLENLIFPEQLVLHMGNDKHTVFYPGAQRFYELILTKLQLRTFKGMKRESLNAIDWDKIRQEDLGVELRFGRPIPFELLQRVFRIDGDFLFSRDSIDRIWIYTSKGREEVRTFFFSADGRYVYESQRADLTVGDVEGYVGFGQFWDPYTSEDGNIYIPDKPITRLMEMEVPFTRYTPDQMQDNLFFDPSSTRIIRDKTGPLYYTDNKKGLKIDQDGTWLFYTDPTAPTSGDDNNMIDNVMSAINFVNEHGGWNGQHKLVKEVEPESGNAIIRFQQYYREVPIVSSSSMNFGYMQLTLQQGLVSSYNRSLLILGSEVTNKHSRQLPGGKPLRELLNQMDPTGKNIEALFPAYKPTIGEQSVVLSPVWAVRLVSGEVVILTESTPVMLK
ncbi:YycH family regulatory protein [Cohnella abietis]|uniref:Transcriptional regulator n=1 Tax=Cohnella abietis TaxID=2507935 RepID=A0A3T1DF21_9BACL|nr:two-component system activity regulator YycH [Cohnella abietis]BBI36766.1 transcriptional regulator [Cohnella abietis]